ncbi:SusC/RagA family TonB-linked outer membrane protein [Reichenbachiella sp. MALMAid0571]|uniref:SusC/RagA family TonB-linked outer membrane protein n=1 Tax=Reichenbachiella sp. MALMAid0571 TaxID=3143939 RepID=UPI0032DE6001
MNLRLLRLLKMTIKFSTCGLILQVFCMTMLYAYNGNAQYTSTSDIIIKNTVNGLNIKEVFDLIESNSDLEMLYLEKDLPEKTTINLKPGSSRSVYDILMEVSKQASLKFRQVNNGISVSPMLKAEVKNNVNRIEVLADVDISGKITDENGDGLPGASVIEKGTANGTTTDLDGQFKLSLPETATLVVSFVGYKTTEITLEGRSVVDVQMELDAEQLEEIVVTALGIEKETRSLTYNVQEISGKSINQVANANFVNNLNGRVAGVTIKSSSSGVGGTSRVVMRGVKSISGNNNALYVVDGIPMPNLSTAQPSDLFSGAGQTGDGISNLNPEDIESISVLTGSAAAALYGSSAANGVVLINTKKGSKEKTTVNISNSTIFSSPLVLPEFQKTYGQSESGSYFSWGEKLTNPSSYDPADFFQTGVNITNSVSLSTGSEKSQTYVSAGTVNSEGIIHNNNYDRYNFSVRNTSKIYETLTLDIGFMSSNVKEQNMVAQGQYFNPFLAVYLFPAGDDFSKVEVYERYNASRNFKTQFWPYGDQGMSIQNPYWITERNKFVNNKERYMGNASLKYQFADWASISGRIKMDKSNEKYQKKFSASTNRLFASDNGYYALNEAATRQIYGEVILNIDKKIQESFNLTANVGSNFLNIDYDQNMYGGNLLGVANLFTYSNVNPSTGESSQSGYASKKQSIFASAQLGYQNLVYLDVTGRNDWSSNLAQSDISSFFYPSVGLTGIISDILALESDVLSLIKVRTSYSEVGNEPNVFLTIPTYPLSSGYPQTQTRMPNTDLRPERTKSWEVGLNLGLFSNSLTLDATFYKSSTYNQFFEPTLSASSGFTSVIVNAGKVNNQGIELTARYNKTVGKFDWNSYLTYSLNRNKIIELLPEWENPKTGEIISLDQLDMGGTGSYKMILKEGGSMGDIYVNTLKTDEHGAIFVDPSSQTVAAESNAFVKAGNSAPKSNVGWGNNLSWDRFSFSFLFTARFGGVVVSNTQAVMDAFGVSKASEEARDSGGALVNGKRIPAKEYYQTIGGTNGGIGSMYIYSATNARLGEVTLGYDVPVNSLANWIQSLNISFVARNLFMIYNKAPYDPELTANTGTYFQGVDYFMTPSLKNIGFSVKLKF